jgi:SEC-C motif
MKVGRNHPCPCGSGKKFKKCCEAKTADHRGHRSVRCAICRRRISPDEEVDRVYLSGRPTNWLHCAQCIAHGVEWPDDLPRDADWPAWDVFRRDHPELDR